MASKVTAGSKAPAFTLPCDGGGKVSLSDFKGQKLVLYFYPKADTSGCTREAIDFSRLKGAFTKAGTAILGVSADPVPKLDKFKTKHSLRSRSAPTKPTRCWRPTGSGRRSRCTAASTWASCATPT